MRDSGQARETNPKTFFMKNTSCHNQAQQLTLQNSFYKTQVEQHFKTELERDLFPNGDLSFQILEQEKEQTVTATITAKQEGILSGKEEGEWLLNNYNLQQKWNKQDAQKLSKGDIIVEIQGRAKDVLVLERTLLNMLGRMSGIATFAKQFINKAGSEVLICPTRKTLWGLLDKKACSIAGAGTHRLNLGTALMLKENHLFLLQDKNILNLQDRLVQQDGAMGDFCEIEVETKEEAMQAIQVLKNLQKTQAVIMFDNFSAENLKHTIKELQQEFPQEMNKILLEASGGLTLDTISEYANSGVDIVSIGALSHSAPHFDFSLRLI